MLTTVLAKIFQRNAAWFYWDSHPEIFRIPLLNHPITWYGLLFALGFLVAFALTRKAFQERLLVRGLSGQEARLHALRRTERLSWMIILGVVVGARLGHVFFYDWEFYKTHLWLIPLIWKGGLASHGGVAGILLAIFLYVYCGQVAPRFSLYFILDVVAEVALFVAGCIRVGNFINQEILGRVTNVPWAVIFLHPADGTYPEPRHPVQLYEAIFYFALFFLVYFLPKRRWPEGFLAGLLLIVLFTFRLIIEFFKAPQGEPELLWGWMMGQWLSLPLIAIGVALCILSRRNCQ